MNRFVWPQYLVEPQYIEGYVEKRQRRVRQPRLTRFERWAADAKRSPDPLSGMKKDGGEKDTDARRRRRRIDDRRRDINSPALHIVVTVIPVIPSTSLFVAAVVVFSHTFLIIIFAESRRHVYTADHGGQNKPHHNLARYGPEIPCSRCFHNRTPFLDRYPLPVWR
jgi:hypothetical protein